MTRRIRQGIALAAVAVTLTSTAWAGIIGESIIVAADGDVKATYRGNSASYDNDLYLDSPANALGIIFQNHISPIGSTMDLGTFTAGTELLFRLHVNNTGDNFFSGPGSRNADGMPHVRVTDNWQPGETLVEFEDLFGTPEGENGFNDLSFSFTNVRGTRSVPDSGSSLLFLAPSALGLLGLARRWMKK